MKKILLPLLAVVAASLLYIQQNKNPSAEVVATLPALGGLESFSLTDQNGNPFSTSALNGKVWLASFMFTSCHGPCPMMNQKYAKLHKDLGDLGHFHQVSITMDPVNDDPKTLKKYGDKFGADFSRWSFLTGEQDQIISVAKKIFKLPAGKDPNMHSTRFVLIDQQGNIRGYYDSLDPGALKKLREHIRALAASQVS